MQIQNAKLYLSTRQLILDDSFNNGYCFTLHLAPVTCHLSPVTRHLSPVTRHPSPVTCHPSPVTCHFAFPVNPTSPYFS